jgi:hypothetical protein
MAPPATPHRWQFSRAGGFDQVRLESAADIANLGELDQKLWAALACPARGIELDERTLALLDADGDGRIRVPEVLAAVRWCGEHLKDLAALKAGSDALPLDSIDDRRDSGRAVLASARQILKDLGKPGNAAISLGDVLETAGVFASTRLNGDGIVSADGAGDEASRILIGEVVSCLGAILDRSGKHGIDQVKLDDFLSQAAAFAAWAAQEDADPALRPLGEATGAAADAWRAVRPKVDDYFTRCRLAAYDALSLPALNRREEDYAALAARDLSADAREIEGFPLSHVEPGRALPLLEGVNPAWAGALARFRDAAVTPILGKDRASITAEEWAAVGARLAPREAWLAAKPATAVEKLGLPRIREILAGKAKDAVAAFIAADRALEREFQAIEQVERLVRYHRDLYRLLTNFVNFRDFYSRERPATFQAGTLYLDGRACSLCVRVDDPGRHVALAGLAKTCLAYCDCTRPSGERMHVAAAFTGGDSDFLMVGRNGIFYDRRGRDWDATITRVVENPISVRQAFWSPYKKLVRLIDEHAARKASAAEAAADAKVAGAAAPPAEPRKIDVGTVAAMGVAFGAIGTLLTSLIGHATGLFVLPFWIICLAFVGLLLLISGPSMVIAWLKLRQRNLAPILDANGWAVNGRVKLSVPLGASLTTVAALPPGSLPASGDPYAERPSPWPKVLAVVVALAFVWSFLDSHLPLVRKWADWLVGTK